MSFGGPRDSFRREALSGQDVVQTVLGRINALAGAGGFTGLVAGTAGAIVGGLGILGTGIGIAAGVIALLALSFFGPPLIAAAGAGVAIGIGECVGRIAKKVLAKKEEENIAKLADIKDEASLTKHWKELKQGDRFFLLDKMIWNEKGFEGEYEKLVAEKVLSKSDKSYFEAASFSRDYKGERKFAEKDPEYKKLDYFVSQAISLNFLEKKTPEELLAIQKLYPNFPRINIALCHTTITDSAETARERFAKTGWNVAKQDLATQEVRLEDIKKIIRDIEAAMESKEA